MLETPIRTRPEVESKVGFNELCLVMDNVYTNTGYEISVSELLNRASKVGFSEAKEASTQDLLTLEYKDSLNGKSGLLLAKVGSAYHTMIYSARCNDDGVVEYELIFGYAEGLDSPIQTRQRPHFTNQTYLESICPYKVELSPTKMQYSISQTHINALDPNQYRALVNRFHKDIYASHSDVMPWSNVVQNEAAYYQGVCMGLLQLAKGSLVTKNDSPYENAFCRYSIKEEAHPVTHYELFGVSPDTPYYIIEESFYALVKVIGAKYPNPRDALSDPEFKKLFDAFRVLAIQDTREAYDAYLAEEMPRAVA